MSLDTIDPNTVILGNQYSQIKRILLIIVNDRVRHHGTRPAGEEDLLLSRQYAIMRTALNEGKTLTSGEVLFKEVCDALGYDLKAMRKVFYGY